MNERGARGLAGSGPSPHPGGAALDGAARAAVPPPVAGLRASVTASAAGKAVEALTLVLLATVVPRALGPGDYGRFAVPLTIVTLGSLAMTLGGPTLMTRFVPAAAPAERVAVARALGARLARGRAVQVAGVAVAAVVAVALAPDTFPPLVTGLVVLALALNTATSVALQIPLGLGRAGPWSARFPVHNAVLVVAVLVLHPRFGPTGAVAALAVAALATSGLAAAVVLPVVRADLPSVTPPAGALRFGAVNAAAAALVQCAHRGGVVAVAVLGGSTDEAGHAALATGVALGVTYAVLQTFTVALPHLAVPAVLDDATGSNVAEATLRRLAGALLAVVLGGCLLTAVLLDRGVTSVFGDEFAEAGAAFGPALAIVVLGPLYALGVQLAAVRLRPDVALASGAATFLAFVLVSLLSVPHLGAAGAMGAVLAGAVAGTAVATWRLRDAAAGWIAVGSYAGAGLVLVVAALA